MAKRENRRKIKRAGGKLGYISVHKSHIKPQLMVRNKGFMDMLDRQLDKLREEILE